MRTPHFGQSMAGDPRVQKGLVLKEIEVAPGLLHRVVHRTIGLTALRDGMAYGLIERLDEFGVRVIVVSGFLVHA
jgi:hypothetical protein